MVETVACRGGNQRFGAKGDTEPSGIEHRQVVRAVADGDRRAGCDAEFGGEPQQYLSFGCAGDDRRQHSASQPVLGNLQSVGGDAVKAELAGNRIGKYRKPAGNERGQGTGPAHRRDEHRSPSGQADPGGGFAEQAALGPDQQRDAGGERAGEIDLAVHRPPCDFANPRTDPEDLTQFIEHFVFDDRRFEIGDEQPLAPPGDRLNQDVDRRIADGRARHRHDRPRLRGIHEQVAGFVRREPVGLGPDRQRFTDPGRELGKTPIEPGGDQGDDEAHRLLSYADAHARGKPQDGMPPVVVIGGPTASGKSALALALAGQLRGTIINADALQCYRDLAILTARPDAAAQVRAPHRLYGFLDAAERGSAGGWRALAMVEIAAARSAESLPIVVGGTGLYLRALRRGLAPFPEIPEKIGEEAAALHRTLGGVAFREQLAELDPEAARRLHAGDTQRLVRAYAVVRATGVSIGAWRDEPHPASPYRFATILMMPARDRLYAACDLRFAAMIDRGALTEAATIAERGLDRGLPAMKAVGLPELLSHLRGESTLAEAVGAGQRATRRYAKRQMTWFRHQSQPDLILDEQFSESLLRRSRQFIDEFLLTDRG